MAEDRNLLERVQDYLVSGDFDRDARYVLGPHLSKGLSGLAQLFGPGADIKAMVDESKRIIPAIKKGDIPGAVAATGLTAVAPLLMGTPGSVKNVRQVSEEVTKQVERYADEPVSYTFTTGRGSTYEAFPSGRTQRDKAPGHRDGGVGLQNPSEKTIFTDGSEQGRRTASDIVGISKNENPTQILPIVNAKNEVIGIKLVHASDLGPKKAGDTILQMPVSTKPDVGKQPIEIFKQGTDIHVGSPITKIEKASDSFPQLSFPSKKTNWWLDEAKDNGTVTLYHGTNIKNLDKIKKEGLGTDTDGFTYLTPDSDTGIGYAVMAQGEKASKRKTGKGYKQVPNKERALLEIEVPIEMIQKNIPVQRSSTSKDKLFSKKGLENFNKADRMKVFGQKNVPVDKKYKTPFYELTEVRFQGPIPPEMIKGYSIKPDNISSSIGKETEEVTKKAEGTFSSKLSKADEKRLNEIKEQFEKQKPQEEVTKKVTDEPVPVIKAVTGDDTKLFGKVRKKDSPNVIRHLLNDDDSAIELLWNVKGGSKPPTMGELTSIRKKMYERTQQALEDFPDEIRVYRMGNLRGDEPISFTLNPNFHTGGLPWAERTAPRGLESYVVKKKDILAAPNAILKEGVGTAYELEVIIPGTKVRFTGPITKKRKGGSVIERNPYGYLPKAI